MDESKPKAQLASAIDLYEDLGNPLFAWEAYRICRENELSLPKPVLDYMDFVASHLLDPNYSKARGPIWARNALSLSTGRGEKYYREFVNERFADAVAEDVAVQLGIDEGLHEGSPRKATVKEAIHKVMDKWRDKRAVELSYNAVHKWYYQERRAAGAKEALDDFRQSVKGPSTE